MNCVAMVVAILKRNEGMTHYTGRLLSLSRPLVLAFSVFLSLVHPLYQHAIWAEAGAGDKVLTLGG